MSNQPPGRGPAPRELPRVRLEGRDGEYYLDIRLRQFRSVTNPHDFIDYGDADQAMAMLDPNFIADVFTISSRSCSWCHEMNDITETKTYCHQCGHRADLPRAKCDCEQCTFDRSRVSSLMTI